MPVVSHKEALQLIANAGRCILYQDRNGNIFMKSSFIPDMQASSANETYFSNTASVLDATEKSTYATPEKDHTEASAVQFFLPYQDKNYLDVGYVSEAVADEDGTFTEDPLVTIVLESAVQSALALHWNLEVIIRLVWYSVPIWERNWWKSIKYLLFLKLLWSIMNSRNLISCRLNFQREYRLTG